MFSIEEELRLARQSCGHAFVSDNPSFGSNFACSPMGAVA
jgi:hypothetical protein